MKQKEHTVLNMAFLLSLAFVSLILSTTSFDIDPIDDGTIEYFISELFNLGDPEKQELIREEVKEHADELLEGVFSLVGDGFEFERDMKKKFNQEFNMEKLQKITVEIFGIGSQIASQVQQHRGAIKQRILDLLDTFMEESSVRKKRSLEDSQTNEGPLDIFNDIIHDQRGSEGSPNTIDVQSGEKTMNEPMKKRRRQKKKQNKIDVVFQDDPGQIMGDGLEWAKVDDPNASVDDNGEQLQKNKVELKSDFIEQRHDNEHQHDDEQWHDDDHRHDDVKLNFKDDDSTHDGAIELHFDDDNEKNFQEPDGVDEHHRKTDKKDKDKKDEVHHRRRWKSDDRSEKQYDDTAIHILDEMEEKFNNLTELVQETGDEMIELGEDSSSDAVNYSKEEMKRNEKRLRKLRKDTKDFLTFYKDRVVKMFKGFGNGLLDILG